MRAMRQYCGTDYQRIQDDSQRLLNRDVESIVFLVKVGRQVACVTLISKVTLRSKPPPFTYSIYNLCIGQFLK